MLAGFSSSPFMSLSICTGTNSAARLFHQASAQRRDFCGSNGTTWAWSCRGTINLVIPVTRP
jgi:hypothetical protein